ncbi:mediator of RNA polymerase II transcription subunit 21-like isoform X2 [Zophobas morio]|uniref:mediator of RNA polymerase II transcription subunit 21-like isoform X2 n=1 Tax=Zophobas morio TaxID=2755281 RepID=UPI003083B981
MDRVTQLQDRVDLLAWYFCDTLRMIPQSFNPAELEGIKDPVSKPDFVDYSLRYQFFSKKICQTVKEILVLADSLPSPESTEAIQELEKEQLALTQEYYAQLEKTQSKLSLIKEAIHIFTEESHVTDALLAQNKSAEKL